MGVPALAAAISFTSGCQDQEVHELRRLICVSLNILSILA